MKNRLNRFLVALLLLLFVGQEAFPQNWTEPVQISTLEGLNVRPDFCIDNNGTIHCVWAYRGETGWYHFVIYYSKSTDEGQSWSEPQNISQNDSMWMDNPHIVADSKNHLHLAYDFNVRNCYRNLIVYRKFDGQNWSEMDTVSRGWPSSSYNHIVVDHNDKVYFFWYHDINNGTELYRELENGHWGDIKAVYDNNDKYYLSKVMVDTANILHCSAYFCYEEQYDEEIVYSTFANSEWSDLTGISKDYAAYEGNDIALDKEGYPHIVWRQSLDNGAPPENGTKYSCFNGSDWSPPKLLAKSSDAQAIAVDNCNGVHILDNEKIDSGFKFMHYQLIEGQWIGELLDSGIYGNYYNKLVNHDGFLYLINGKPDTIINIDVVSSIFFRKYAITTAVEEGKLQAFDSFRLYPNPSRGSTTIDYTLKEEAPILIEVYGLNGKMIDKILDKRQTAGRYQIKWNGTDKNRKEVKNGLYLIRLQAGRYFTARPVEIVR